MNALRVTNLILILTALSAASWLSLSAFQPPRANWGDPTSEFNAHTSGLIFQIYGFIATKFQPILDIRPLSTDPHYYTHYPPLPDWLDGVLRILFNFNELYQFRFIAVAMSFGGVFYFYLTTRRVLGPLVATASTIFWIANPLFLQYADLFHHVPLYMLFGQGTLYWFTRYLFGRGRLDLAAASAHAFLTSLSSYDYDLFLPITLLGLAFLLKSSPLFLWRRIVAAGSTMIALAAALVLRFSINIWALGAQGAISDIFFQIEERTTSQDISFDHWFAYPSTLLARMVRFYTPLLFVAVALFSVELFILVRRRRSLGTGFEARYASLLLIAGVAFLLVFSELTVEQIPPMLLLLPFYATSTGVIIIRLLSKGQSSRAASIGRFSPGRWFRPRYAVAVVMVSLAVFATISEVVMFPKAYVSIQDLQQVRNYLDQHDDNRYVLTNGVVDSLHRYYLNHDMLSILTIPSDQQLEWVEGQVFPNPAGRIFFLYYRNVWNYYYDKGLFSPILGSGRIDWYSFPELHHQEITQYLTTLDDQLYSTVHTFGMRVLETPSMELWEFNDASILAGREMLLGNARTTEIDFGTQQGLLYLGEGFRFNEVDGSGRRFNWAVGPVAQLIVNLVQGRSSGLNFTVSAPYVNQTMSVSVSGVTLAGYSFAKASSWTSLEFQVPSRLVQSAGWYTLDITFGPGYGGGFYVAFNNLVVN